MKKVIIIAIALQGILFANFFNFEEVKVTKDISCVIGDYNPILKENRGFVSNVCYVDTGDFLVLIDTGATYNFAKELMAFIEGKRAKKIKYAVVTNYHDDRYLGASYLKQHNVQIISAFNLEQSKKNIEQRFANISRILPKDLLEGTVVVTPDILVEKEYIIEGSKKSVKILKLSEGSQSPTDLVVLSPDDRFAFAGNIVFNGRFVNYAEDSNMDGWIEALRALERMNLAYIMGGHGDDFDAHSYEPTLKYLSLLKQQVKKAYEADIDPVDLSKNIHTDIFQSIPHYEELYLRNARNYFNQLEWQ